MVKALIFGGAGFIGTHLFNTLRALQYKTLIADIVAPTDEARDYLNIDVRNEISGIGGIDQDTVVYNLAAIHKTPGHEDHEYFETNIRGAENVCTFAHEHHINTIVFTSSIAPYGPTEFEKYESNLATPNSPYGISKLVAEEIHKRWQARDPENRRLIILRPGVVFGMGEGGNFTRLYQALKKRYFFYPGRKDTRKAAIYVKDLTRLMVEMAKNEPPGVHLYNMCYPHPHSIQDIVHSISSVTGTTKTVPLVPAWMLRTMAHTISLFMGKKTPLHPDRISKLLFSTNINGEKLKNAGHDLEYDLESALADWYADNDGQSLS
ncbi:MAG: SDR family oxidoreductase [Candidatus Marinimicrobia bacterium]|nr:SDR family oxidoreductase [Candidatus Neomarinimicrobiota bacterium]MCF7850183.1 SDR family oxidoreductase [Candidatus Neomarinimicrobiota bacterium]